MALRELDEGIRQLQLRAGEHAGQLRELQLPTSGTTAQRDARYGSPATAGSACTVA